jgi:protein-disulfide isomerase
VVEFFDYNCGYCKRAGANVKKALGDDGNARLVYKELPILSESSKVAAVAALAAARQGKYAQMHEALMGARGALDQARIMGIASDLKLDMAKLQKDMADPAIEAAIQKNLALAAALGVNGTPGFVIGDKLIPGAVDADVLKKAIADARAKRG